MALNLILFSNNDANHDPHTLVEKMLKLLRKKENTVNRTNLKTSSILYKLTHSTRDVKSNEKIG